MQRILKSDLKMTKLAAKFVPRLLTDAQKANRLEISRRNLELLDQDRLLLTKIVIRDESWCFVYDPDTKQASAQWTPKGGARPVKALRARATKKLLVTVFFDSTSLLLVNFRHCTINKELYCEILTKLRAAVRKRRPHLWDFCDDGDRRMWLLHDNARPHVAHKTVTTLAESRIRIMDHPPYSPDLAPSDFFLFPKLKAHLRGTRFESLEALQDEVSTFLRRVPRDEYHNAIVELAHRWRKCVAHEGGYFEGQKHPCLPAVPALGCDSE